MSILKNVVLLINIGISPFIKRCSSKYPAIRNICCWLPKGKDLFFGVAFSGLVQSEQMSAYG